MDSQAPMERHCVRPCGRGAAEPGYSAVELRWPQGIGSVSLFADSNRLPRRYPPSMPHSRRARLEHTPPFTGRHGACGHLLAPGLPRCGTAWEKVALPVPPAPVPLFPCGGGALASTCSAPFSWRASAP